MAPNAPGDGVNALSNHTLNQLGAMVRNELEQQMRRDITKQIRAEIAPLEKKLDTLAMQLGLRQDFHVMYGKD